ncbi:hypothetical protein [Hoeflea sp.]|uniref:hypothetical protein n=1 Tax=Hoeflea sp. TaxID=1940281 RepID=UPI003B51C929
MKTSIWIVTTTIPERGEGPCMPSPFGTEAEAEAYADEMMRAEWKSHGVDDDGDPAEYPGDWREAQRSILQTFNDGSWGEWQITKHTIEIPDAPHPAAAFIERMAQYTTPEDEFADPALGHADRYADADELVSDMDDEQLCAAFSQFMDMVREARKVRDAMAAPEPARIAITIRGGVAEVADAENWPSGLELYLVDYDQDDGGSHLDGPCSVAKYCDDTPAADGMTGHFAAKVAEAWAND